MIDFGFGVLLGPIDRANLKTMRDWRNDVRIRKWCRQYDLITEAKHLDWYEGLAKSPSTAMYIVNIPLDQEDSFRPVGVTGFTSIDLVNRRAEFSLYIAPNEQRNGYARSALKTLFSHGFESFGLNSIWGESFDGNPAMNLFDSIGMKREGVRRQFYFKEGKFLDAHLFSLQRSEFKP